MEELYMDEDMLRARKEARQDERKRIVARLRKLLAEYTAIDQDGNLTGLERPRISPGRLEAEIEAIERGEV